MPPNWDQVTKQFVALGRDAHATPFGMVAVDIPGSVPPAPVLRLLEQGQVTGTWHYDLGVIPTWPTRQPPAAGS